MNPTLKTKPQTFLESLTLFVSLIFPPFLPRSPYYLKYVRPKYKRPERDIKKFVEGTRFVEETLSDKGLI